MDFKIFLQIKICFEVFYFLNINSILQSFLSPNNDENKPDKPVNIDAKNSPNFEMPDIDSRIYTTPSSAFKLAKEFKSQSWLIIPYYYIIIMIIDYWNKFESILNSDARMKPFSNREDAVRFAEMGFASSTSATSLDSTPMKPPRTPLRHLRLAPSPSLLFIDDF